MPMPELHTAPALSCLCGIFFNFFIITSGGLVTAWFVREDTVFSVFILFFMFFARINFIAAILLLQLDRLLAIACPYFRKSDITTSLSFKVILTTMIFIFLVAISATISDPGLVHHQSCYRCLFVRISSVFLHIFLHCLVFSSPWLFQYWPQ